MSEPTFMVPMIRLDIPDAEPEMVEVYQDGTFVADPWPDRVLTLAEETVTVTRAELADLIAAAAAAAVAAQAGQADPDAARTAALTAIKDQAD